MKIFAALLPNYHNRRLEWALAFYLLYIGAFLALPPLQMSSPSYRAVLDRASEGSWALTFLLEGLLLYFALQVNGRAAWTPFLRAGALFISAQTFLVFAMSLSQVALGMSFATFLFISLGFCGIAFSTAAYDCGREIKIWRARYGQH